MKSWQDITTEFDDIRNSIKGNRIDAEIIYIGNSVSNESEPTWELKEIRRIFFTPYGHQEWKNKVNTAWSRFESVAKIAGEKLLTLEGIELQEEIQKTECNVERWLLYLLHKKPDPHSELSPTPGYTEGKEKQVRINNVIEASQQVAAELCGLDKDW